MFRSIRKACNASMGKTVTTLVLGSGVAGTLTFGAHSLYQLGLRQGIAQSKRRQERIHSRKPEWERRGFDLTLTQADEAMLNAWMDIDEETGNCTEYCWDDYWPGDEDCGNVEHHARFPHNEPMSLGLFGTLRHLDTHVPLRLVPEALIPPGEEDGDPNKSLFENRAARLLGVHATPKGHASSETSTTARVPIVPIPGNVGDA